MRDRFRVVCQAGRVAVPTWGTSTLVLADHWIREVRHDGNKRSWHAKLALVRYKSMEAPDSDAEWRLWLGSRNLTRDTSWDSALTALGKISRTTNSIDQSVARAGAVLAEKAALPEWSATNVEDELRRLHWQWPEDVQEVVSFAMWPDAQVNPWIPETTSRPAACCRGEPVCERLRRKETVGMGPEGEAPPVVDDPPDSGGAGGP